MNHRAVPFVRPQERKRTYKGKPIVDSKQLKVVGNPARWRTAGRSEEVLVNMNRKPVGGSIRAESPQDTFRDFRIGDAMGKQDAERKRAP